MSQRKNQTILAIKKKMNIFNTNAKLSDLPDIHLDKLMRRSGMIPGLYKDGEIVNEGLKRQLYCYLAIISIFIIAFRCDVAIFVDDERWLIRLGDWTQYITGERKFFTFLFGCWWTL